MPVATQVSERAQARILVEQGTLLLREKKLDQAQASFEVAYQLAGLAAALDGLGCVAFARGQYLLAEKHFKQAYESDADYNNSLINLALLLEFTGRYQLAKDAYIQALRYNPNSYQLRNNYAGFMWRLSYASSAEVKAELLRAQVLLDHPQIRSNILIVERGADY